MKLLELTKTFNEKINRMFEFTSGKKVVIWGYGYGGQFIENIYKKNNKQVDLIIDNNFASKCNYSYYLRTLDPQCSSVIVTFTPTDKDIEFLNSLGFIENKNVFLAKQAILSHNNGGYLSYTKYLEANVSGLDFTKAEDNRVSGVNIDNHVYGCSHDFSIENIFDNFVIKDSDAIFDFGCGKGATFPIFIKCGFKKMGGVELDKKIYDILTNNMKLLDINTISIYNEDATKLKEILDEYNYFYMYNPFEGEIFKQIIYNIEESYNRKKRKIFLIYTAPVCQKFLLERKLFHVVKEVETSFYESKDALIYEIGEG